MSKAVLAARSLSKHFDVRSVQGRARLLAVDDVDLSIARGEVLGVVGESGCGKSTLAGLLVGLIAPSSGSIELAGQPLVPGRDTFKRVQFVFQDPKSSLNPQKSVAQILDAPQRHLTSRTRAERAQRIPELLSLVELQPELASRYPHELSGGQAQRVAIARALAVDPELLVLDEAVAALDVRSQAKVLELLARLKQERGLSYLFISHDLGVVRSLADRVAVMYLGRVVETASTGQLFGDPAHPYTRCLLSAVPRLDGPLRRIPLSGEPPSALGVPAGCAFHPRCYRAEGRCAKERPNLDSGQVEHPTACFFAHDSQPQASPA